MFFVSPIMRCIAMLFILYLTDEPVSDSECRRCKKKGAGEYNTRCLWIKREGESINMVVDIECVCVTNLSNPLLRTPTVHFSF